MTLTSPGRRNRAVDRQLPFALTEVEYGELLQLPRTDCGETLPEAKAWPGRLDNARGYEADNVVPCCCQWNVARCDNWTPAEMKEIGTVFATLRQRRQQV